MLSLSEAKDSRNVNYVVKEKTIWLPLVAGVFENNAIPLTTNQPKCK
jgi:hypothetical protein